MVDFMALEEVDRRASALGLSYGQYVAQYRPNEHISEKKTKYHEPFDADGKPIRTVIRNRRHLQKQADQIVRMYGEGSTIESMAEVLDIPEIEMARFIKLSGLTRAECRAGTTFGYPQSEPVEENPCAQCRISRCDDRKMCRRYKSWFSVAWNKTVAPFRELQART